ELVELGRLGLELALERFQIVAGGAGPGRVRLVVFFEAQVEGRLGDDPLLDRIAHFFQILDACVQPPVALEEGALGPHRLVDLIDQARWHPAQRSMAARSARSTAITSEELPPTCLEMRSSSVTERRRLGRRSLKSVLSSSFAASHNEGTSRATAAAKISPGRRHKKRI